jgi:hypothetical protein
LLTFAPGETSKTVTVVVAGDFLGESNETFFVNLGQPTNATIGQGQGQGVGTIVDDDAPTGPQQPLPQQPIKINFQPLGAPIPNGYVADTGLVFADRGGGLAFGWNADNSGRARDRNAALAPDQRYDTLTHIADAGGGSIWELALPYGTYSVKLVAGDPAHFDSAYRLTAENVQVVTGTPTSQSRWVEGTATVTVADGRLTIRSGAGAVNNKLNFIEVTALGGGVPPPAVSAKINFQPSGKPVPAGYVADTGLIFAPRGGGLTYGWNMEVVRDMKDREDPLSPDQRYDTLAHMQKFRGSVWEMLVPNGRYQVRIVSGDPTYYDSVHMINVENVLAVDFLPSAQNPWLDNTVTVTVLDGRLTVSSAVGSVNNKIAFIEVTSV